VSFIAGLSLVPAAGLVNQSSETRCEAKRVLHMTVEGKGRISVNASSQLMCFASIINHLGA